MKALAIFLFFTLFIASLNATPTCAAYCTSVMTNCVGANAQYPDNATCLAVCANYPVGLDADTTGNTLGCRTYHAGAAASGAALHCPHAGPTGGNSASFCGTACAAYCNITAGVCTGANAVVSDPTTCMGFCGTIPVSGTFSLTNVTVDSLECRLYHVSAATGTGLASTHCPHATPSGGNFCGNWCTVYCDLALSVCTGSNQLFTSMTSCMSTCSGFAITGKPGDTTGNTVQCRIYHIGAAGALQLQSLHCPHGGMVSATCGGGSTSGTGTGTGTGGSGTGTGTGNAFGLIISFISLIGLLLI